MLWKVEGDVKIAGAEHPHKYRPAQVQSHPQRAGHAEDMTEELFDEQLSSDDVAAEKGQRRDPGDERRFPFDESLAVQGQGQTTEDEGEHEGAGLGGVQGAAMPVNTGIDHDGTDQQHCGGCINAQGFKAGKEQQQGNEIEELFHGEGRSYIIG